MLPEGSLDISTRLCMAIYEEKGFISCGKYEAFRTKPNWPCVKFGKGSLNFGLNPICKRAEGAMTRIRSARRFDFTFDNDLAFRSKPIRPCVKWGRGSDFGSTLFARGRKAVKRTRVLQGPFGPSVGSKTGSKTTPKNANRP